MDKSVHPLEPQLLGAQLPTPVILDTLSIEALPGLVKLI